MSAHTILSAPLGSIISWSDGMPRPPERHSKKLAVCGTRNSSGRLIRKDDSRILGSYTAPALTVIERPPIGSIRVFDRHGPSHELVHLAADREAAETWLKLHRHPLGVLEEVTADEVAVDHVEGRAA